MHEIKAIDIFWLYVMLKNTLALINTLVCSKTMTKFTFRRYKHSNLTISHFCPIKCSLVSPPPNEAAAKIGHLFTYLLFSNGT